MQKKTRRFERTAASVCKEYAILTLATLVMSAGTYLFKFPNNFSFGGVTGLAVVLSAVSPLSAGTYNFIINMALLVLGFLFLGLWRKDGVHQRFDVCGTVCGGKAVSHVRTAD